MKGRAPGGKRACHGTLGIGTEDRLYQGVKTSHENLLKAGITHTWVETPGAHVWPVWRKYLAEFAPLLFR